MCTTFVVQNVVRFLVLFLYLSVTITHAYNETVINEMAVKLNMSNETLFVLFRPITANFTGYYNTTEVDTRIQQYNYTLWSVNTSVNLQLGKLLSSLLDSYVNASVSNASYKISPLIAVLRDDMNIRFDALKNTTVKNYQLERNITELNQNVTQYAYSTSLSIKQQLDNKIDWNFMLAFFMSVIIPTGIYLATTRIYSLRMKILGSVQDLRKYAIEDLNLNPMTQEEIKRRKELKMTIIKTKCEPAIMKALLQKVDTDEINDEQSIKDIMEIIKKERELDNETNNKHQVKPNGKTKRG